ncbi:hypothetical protein AAVH_19545 [Aphelenchoides avenae]|nr:hypothetical protein AAVH_19545 [Aphelenchus avenae]
MVLLALFGTFCYAQAATGGTDGTVKYQFTINPPLPWTYSMRNDSTVSFFPGQPSSSESAQRNAERHLLSAVKEAARSSGLSLLASLKLSVSTDFRAPLVANCKWDPRGANDSSNATPRGASFGITQLLGSWLAPPTVVYRAQSIVGSVSVPQCAALQLGQFCAPNILKFGFTEDVKLEVQGLNSTLQEKKNIAAYLTTILSYNYGARVQGWVNVVSY